MKGENKDSRPPDTQCERMMSHDYTWRHDEVVKSILLHFGYNYGMVRKPKPRAFKVESVMGTNVAIMTHNKVKATADSSSASTWRRLETGRSEQQSSHCCDDENQPRPN